MHSPRELIEMDVRPGGVFRVVMVQSATGAEFPSDMRFTKVDEPSVLEFEWDGQRGIGGGRSTITFRDLGDGRTEMTNHYAGYTTDVIEGFMVAGSKQQFDKLQAYLTRGSGRPARRAGRAVTHLAGAGRHVGGRSEAPPQRWGLRPVSGRLGQLSPPVSPTGAADT